MSGGRAAAGAMLGRERAFAAAVLAVLAGAAAIAAVAATRFLPDLSDARPPLAAEPALPAPAPAPARPTPGATAPRLARRAVLVVVDGLRLDASSGTALDELRRRGVDARLRAPFPTLSKPNHATLVTGVPPRWSGVRTNDVTARIALDSVIARARAAGLRVGYVSDRSRALPDLLGAGAFDEVAIGEADLDVRFADTVARAELVVLVLMDVDRAGHRHGGDSRAYREAARAQLARVGRLLGALDLGADAVAVTADHGHSDRGGHGGAGADVALVPLVLAGAGIRDGGALAGPGDLADVAPTLAALLGLPAPRHASGRALAEVLALPVADRAALARADGDRRARLAAIHRAIEEADADRHRAARALRLPIAALALAALIYLAVRAARAARTGLGPLAAAPAFAAAYLALLLLARDPGIPGDRLSLWLEHARYGAIAIAAHLIAYAAATRRRDASASPAPAVALAGLAVTAAPALAAWALVGETLAAMLPDPALIAAPPLAYAGVAFYAAAAAGTFAIDALRARSSRRIAP